MVVQGPNTTDLPRFVYQNLLASKYDIWHIILAGSVPGGLLMQYMMGNPITHCYLLGSSKSLNESTCVEPLTL